MLVPDSKHETYIRRAWLLIKILWVVVILGWIILLAWIITGSFR